MTATTEQRVPCKPIRATVVESKEDWLKLVAMVQAPISEERLRAAEERARLFFPERFAK
jgi:hypothetical protein